MRTFIILFTLGILSYSCSDPLNRLEEGTYYFYDAENTNRYPLEFEMKKWNDTIFFDHLERQEGTWRGSNENGGWWMQWKIVVKIPLSSSDNKIFTHRTNYGYPAWSPHEYESGGNTSIDVYEVKGGEVLIFSDRGDLEEFLSKNVYDEYPSSK